MKMEVRYAVLSVAEFANHVSMPPDKVLGVKVVAGLRDEEGNIFTGCLLSLAGLPEQLQRRTIVIYYDMGTSWMEQVVSPSTQVRRGQAVDQFKLNMQNAMACRDSSLRSTARPIDYSSVLAKVKDIQAARTRNDEQQDEDEDEDVVDVDNSDDDDDFGGGRRGRPSARMVARPAVAKKKERKKPAAGVAAAAASSKRRVSSAASVGGASGGGQAGQPASSSTSVLKYSTDLMGSGNSKKGTSVIAEDEEEGAMTLRTVYPTLDINQVLLGAKLKRSLKGVTVLVILVGHLSIQY
jgi:hypothetical protein